MKVTKPEARMVKAGINRQKCNIQIYLLKYTLMLWTDFTRVKQHIVMGCYDHYKAHFRCNTRELGTC